jgi:hypothetical protein
MSRFTELKLDPSFDNFIMTYSPSQWSSGLRYILSSAARTVGSWVRIPLEAWMCPRFSVLCCPVCR